jgi:hypothetical protein
MLTEDEKFFKKGFCHQAWLGLFFIFLPVAEIPFWPGLIVSSLKWRNGSCWKNHFPHH